MKVDLHTHLATKWSPWILEPRTKTRSPDWVIPQLVEKGLDAIGLLNFNDFRYETFVETETEKYHIEHNSGFSTFMPKDKSHKDFFVIKGQETPVSDGYHVVLFGNDSHSSVYEYLPTEEIKKYADERNLTLIADHSIPGHFLKKARNICVGIDRLEKNRDYFHAFEGLNGNYKYVPEEKLIELEKRVGLSSLAGSDSHSVDNIGKYRIDIDLDFSNKDNFKESLRENIQTGKFKRIVGKDKSYIAQSMSHAGLLLPGMACRKASEVIDKIKSIPIHLAAR